MMAKFEGNQVDNVFASPENTTVSTTTIDMEYQEMTLIVLSNPVVLDCIFNKLDVSSLKNVRLVSSVWEDVASLALSKKTLIRFKGQHPCCRKGKTLLLNTKLVKSVFIDFDCTCPKLEDEIVDENRPLCPLTNSPAGSNLMEFMYHHHEGLEFLKINEDVDIVNSVFEVLSNDKRRFTNLKHLQVSIFRNTCKEELKICNQICHLPALSRIKFDFPPYDGYTGNDYIVLQKNLQFLINAAPLLKQLLIKGNFYPDLTNSTNLKTLEISRDRALRPFLGDGTLDMVQFNKILKQVAGSLVRLMVHTYNDDGHTVGDVGHFPVMPKLSSLFLHPSVNCFKNLRINSKNYPKLRDLSLSENSVNSVFNKGIHISQNSIEILDNFYGREECYIGLNFGGSELSYAEKFVWIFPHITKLVFEAHFSQDEQTMDKVPRFEGVMKAFGKWEMLNEASIRISEVKSMSDASAMLDMIAELKGSKKIDIAFYQSYLRERDVPVFDTLSDSVKNALLHYRGMESVKILHLVVTESVLKEIEEFARFNMVGIELKHTIVLDDNDGFSELLGNKSLDKIHFQDFYFNGCTI